MGQYAGGWIDPPERMYFWVFGNKVDSIEKERATQHR